MARNCWRICVRGKSVAEFECKIKNLAFLIRLIMTCGLVLVVCDKFCAYFNFKSKFAFCLSAFAEISQFHLCDFLVSKFIFEFLLRN